MAVLVAAVEVAVLRSNIAHVVPVLQLHSGSVSPFRSLSHSLTHAGLLTNRLDGSLEGCLPVNRLDGGVGRRKDRSLFEGGIH